MKLKPLNKTGGVVSDLVNGTSSLIIGVIIAFVIVSTLLGASLLSTGSTYDNSSAQLSQNFTAGVDNVAEKIPTILLIAAVVLLFGVLVVLVIQARKMGVGGGGGSL